MAPIDLPLTELTATQALARMRAGRLSPVALVEAVLNSIAAQDPVLKAWVSLDRSGSLNAAHVAERAWHEGTAGPLCGIPISVKDLLFTRGLPTSANFEPFRERDPGVDATCIARLRAAGAIILGKVQTTQFAGRDPSPTCNPWNLSRTASGSSSGSAVSVAARMVPVSVATQTGGSIIRPAAYLGVVGFSPTYGRVSRSGLLPRSFSFDTIGSISRSVDDAELLFGIMAGPDPADPSTLLQRPPRKSRGVRKQPPRLGLIEDFVARSTPDTAARFEAAIERLVANGAHVQRARLPVALEVLLAIHTTILFSEAAASQSSTAATAPRAVRARAPRAARTRECDTGARIHAGPAAQASCADAAHDPVEWGGCARSAVHARWSAGPQHDRSTFLPGPMDHHGLAKHHRSTRTER